LKASELDSFESDFPNGDSCVFGQDLPVRGLMILSRFDGGRAWLHNILSQTKLCVSALWRRLEDEIVRSAEMALGPDSDRGHLFVSARLGQRFDETL